MTVPNARPSTWSESAQAQNLREFLKWLLPWHRALGGVTEIRIIGKGAMRGVWCAHLELGDEEWLITALAPAMAGQDARDAYPRVGEANIYFSLNPVNPALRQGRRIRRAERTARDQDIRAYCLFVVDVDPERRPRDCSATDSEKAEALKVAESIHTWFQERGVNTLCADSGNGYHLLVPLVPATGDDVRQAARDAQTLLRYLDRRFSTHGAKVDLSTFNPSRILKLYGTMAVKGQPDATRPHRFSSIDLRDIPDEMDLFGRLAHEFSSTAVEPVKPARPAPQKLGSGPSRGADSNPVWAEWRRRALERLPLEQVYGGLLTGQHSGASWLQCRDPESESGDQDPSAGVADGTGDVERGAFHSFRSAETRSVFDILVRWGKAGDFKEARKLVAELSGVPLPQRTEPPARGSAPAQTGASSSPEEFAEKFRQKWSAASSESERSKVLRSAITHVMQLPAFERNARLETIRITAGLAPGLLRDLLNEAKRSQPKPIRKVEDARRQEPDKSTVTWVEDRDMVGKLFRALVDTVAPAQCLFRAEHDLVFVEPGMGPFTVTERNIAGLLTHLVEIRFMRNGEDGPEFDRYDILPGDLARAFVNSLEVRRRLPMLRMYTRSPVFDKNWHFIGKPGFQPSSGIYYDGPEVIPRSGKAYLEAPLKDFHWKTATDLVNAFGVLLTSLTMPLWGGGHPFLAINGNKPGVGKSTLAKVLAVIAEGHVPSTITFTPDDTEFEKQLATRVELGDRVILIDNAKMHGTIESAVLERCITDSRINFRRLGSNTAITRPENDILICLTMNLTQIGADLRRRALPLNLEMQANVRSVKYAEDDVIGLARHTRLEIIAELALMVQSWLSGGRPQPESPARHSTSQIWAATIDSILTYAGLPGFLSNFDESEHAFDPKYQIMLEIAEAHHAKPHSTAAEWANWLQTGPLEERFKDRRGELKSARARATIVGSFFTEYLDTQFAVGEATYTVVRTYPEGPTRSACYGFQELTNPEPGSSF